MTQQPTKKAAGACNTNGLNTDHNTADFRTSEPTNQAIDQPRFAVLKARAALAGHTLSHCAGDYILSRWTYAKSCINLDAVEALLQRMGA